MPPTIDGLLLVSGVIALGFLVAVAFYESLSTRDVLVARTMRIARGSTRRPWLIGATYLVTVGIGIPALVVPWTAVLELALFFVGSVDRVASTPLVAVSVVGAARILAYVRQKTAHELAKAIPLAFAFALLTGGALNLEQKLSAISARPETVGLTDTMIVFLIALEVGLRLLTDGSHAVLGSIRRRRGIDSELGVWRTLWAAVRRPLPVALAEATAVDAPPVGQQRS